MHWQFFCPGCDRPLQGRPPEAGLWGRCPGCLAPFRVPGPPSPPPPAAVPGPPRWRLLAAALGLLVLVGVGMWGRPSGPRPVGQRVKRAVEAPDNGQMKIRPIEPHERAPGKAALPPSEPVLIDTPVQNELRSGGAPILARAGRILRPAACVFAPGRGPIFTATADGRLVAHAGVSLAALGEARLPGPAYHLALDAGKGVLYAAVAAVQKINVSRLGDHDSPAADVMAFDVSAALAGRPLAGRPAPVTVHACASPVHGLALSADGASLYVLHEGGRGPTLTLVNTADRTVTRSFRRPPGGAAGIALSPDDGRVYLLAGGRVSAHTPSLDEVKGSVIVGASCSTPTALPGGRLLLLDRRAGTHLLELDLPTARVVSRWALPREGKWAIHAAGARVALSESSVLQGRLWLVDPGASAFTLAGEAASNQDSLIRGRPHANADGSLVVLGNGEVYRAGG